MTDRDAHGNGESHYQSPAVFFDEANAVPPKFTHTSHDGQMQLAGTGRRGATNRIFDDGSCAAYWQLVGNFDRPPAACSRSLIHR
jgi:hypothetical protein